MSLKSKILILCGFFTFIIFAIGGTTYVLSNKVEAETTAAIAVLPNIETNYEMFLAFRRVRINVMALGITGASIEFVAEKEKAYHEYASKYDELVTKRRAMGFRSEERRNAFEATVKVWTDYREAAEKARAQFKAGGPEAHAQYLKFLETQESALAHPYNEHNQGMTEANHKYMEEKFQLVKNMEDESDLIIIGGTLFGILCGFGIGFWVATSIAKNLSSVSTELGASAGEVSTASFQLSQSSTQMANGASESAASLEEGVASIEELSSMVKMNADNALQASSLSSEGALQAKESLQEMANLLKCIEGIEGSSKKIQEIIHVIDDIAFQTNLLALNASVEAARAGDQGKGFAVVAEAVRSLAQKSATSAKEINELIKTSGEQVQTGVEIARVNETVLVKLSGSIKKIADLNLEISTASKEQAAGVNQLSVAMTQLDKSVQLNAAAAEEVSASAEQMSEQAEVLKTSVTVLNTIIVGAKATKDPAPYTAGSKVTPLNSQRKSTLNPIPLAEDSRSGFSKASDF